MRHLESQLLNQSWAGNMDQELSKRNVVLLVARSTRAFEEQCEDGCEAEAGSHAEHPEVS